MTHAARADLFEFIETPTYRRRHPAGLGNSPQPSTPLASVIDYKPVSERRGQHPCTRVSIADLRLSDIDGQ